MTRYLVQPRYQIFVEGYGFLSFAKIFEDLSLSKILIGL